MKKAFITTVYNDEKGIVKLLNSLLVQTVLPDEIVIVDAISSDDTYKIAKSFKEKFTKSNFKIFKAFGNRSVGRNAAIKSTASQVIAVSDSGCVLKKDWFEKITEAFINKKVDVVAGFYKPITNSAFEQSLSVYTCFPEDKVNNDFLPSSRSIAFKKFAWEKVGGYPEELNTCEDLVFAKRLKSMGLKFEVVKDAVVYWPQRKNLWQAAKQFYSYANGDGQAFYIRPQTPLLFIRYMIVLLLIALFLYTQETPLLYVIYSFLFLYFLWSMSKNYKYLDNASAIFYLPFLQLIADVSVLLGMSVGIFQRIFKDLNSNYVVL